MTDKSMLSDVELDSLFGAARAHPAMGEPDLMARVLADAEAVQPRGPARRARMSKPPFWQQLVAVLGGWPAVAGLASATVAGVWIGASNPTLLDAGLNPFSTNADAQYLSDLTSEFDYDLSES